jgi:hypothetical protein
MESVIDFKRDVYKLALTELAPFLKREPRHLRASGPKRAISP